MADFKHADGFINLSIKGADGKLHRLQVCCPMHLDKDTNGLLAQLLGMDGEKIHLVGEIKVAGEKTNKPVQLHEDAKVK